MLRFLVLTSQYPRTDVLLETFKVLIILANYKNTKIWFKIAGNIIQACIITSWDEIIIKLFLVRDMFSIKADRIMQ